jgi:hypothetical protein
MSWAIFPAVGLAQRRPRPIFTCELACQPITAPPSLTDGARLSAPSSPKYSLLRSPSWQCRPNCRRRADHPSPPRATRMAECSPTTLKCHVSCGVPWCPITAACCSASAYRCSSRDARTRSSTTKPHTACPAGRADTAETTPSRPQRSPAGERT